MHVLARTLVAALLLGALASCHRHHLHPHGLPPGRAKHLAHHHGAGCGHELVGGAWIVKVHAPGKRGKH